MTCIVTTTYRYKPPPKRRKPVAIPQRIVTAKGSRRRVLEAAAEAEVTARLGKAGDIQPSTPLGKASTPATDDRKSAIATGRKPRSWRSDVLDMTPEEHQRRGDTADALFREMKRRIGKV